jgi:hypothetical protein
VLDYKVVRFWYYLPLAVLPILAASIGLSSVSAPDVPSLGQRVSGVGEADTAEYWHLRSRYLFADSGGGASNSRRPSSESRSIFIDANTVLCIADKGLQPSGKPVPPKGKRPAGIALSGVSALGVGVLDGDVLTEVLGQPVRSQAQVIALVMVARGANKSTISATIWRGLRAYSITVEQPYDVSDCSAEGSNCWRSKCRDDRVSNRATVSKGSSVPKRKK